VTAHLDRAYAIGTTDPELRRVMSGLLGELAGALTDVGRRQDAARRLEQVLALESAGGAPAARLEEIRARIGALREASP